MKDAALPYKDLTLDQALEIFRRENDLEAKYRDLRPEAQAHYERHDIIHVLFGLDTSIRQEAQADGWTILASDIGWSDIREFLALPEEKQLIKEIGWTNIVSGFARAIPDFVKMAWQSRRLHKKWKWRDNAQYRDQNVDAIRREFGIDRTLAA